MHDSNTAQPRCYLVEISEPLTADCRLEIVKARNFSSGMRKIWDETTSDGIRYPSKYDRDRARDLQCCRDHRIRSGKDHIRRKRHDFSCHAAHPILALACEAVIKPNVAPVHPAELLQGLTEGRQIGPPNLVVFCEAHENANMLRLIVLLCKCSEGQECRAAEKRDELAPSHGMPS